MSSPLGPSPFYSGGTGTGTGPLPFCGTPSVVGGPVDWDVHQNKDYTRDYRISFRVRINPSTNGPYAALYAAGLPRAGTVWLDTPLSSVMPNPGAQEDPWAWFTGERTVKKDPTEKDGGNQFYIVECLATTKPTQDCIAEGIDNPLAIPDRIRVESVTYSIEGTEDRFGDPLISSSWEQYRGAQIEYDADRFRIYVEQNVAGPLPLSMYQTYLQTVNDAPLWGFATRTVKFSHFEAEPRYYLNCNRYWLCRFMFDAGYDFDKCLLDEGTQALRGMWDKSKFSPTYGQFLLATKTVGASQVYVDPQIQTDIEQYKDWSGNPARVILNGNARPYTAPPAGIQTGSITNATNATPIVITSNNFNLATGDTVVITGVTGNTAANGTWVITGLTTSTFQLNGSVGDGAYESGGSWTYTPSIGKNCFQYYDQSNLLLLGIPPSLG